MALSDTSKINISIKKLSGKAQTSNDKDLANEGLPSGVTISSETVFGDIIPTSPSNSSLYDRTDGVVEYVRFQASFIAGTDTSSGRHAFELKLPSDYESSSSNPAAGSYPFVNNQSVYITSGALQLVPTAFASLYEPKPFYGGTSAKNSGTQIPILDARDWNLDFFNGIMFQQDPPGTGDHSENPDFVEGFLYIGRFVSEIIANGTGDPNAEYAVTTLTGSLPNAKRITGGAGITVTTSSNTVTFATDINHTTRVKATRGISSRIPATNDVDLSIDFTSVDRNPNRIDVFVNGQLLVCGSNNDYILNTSKTGSIHFNFDLVIDDQVVTTLI